MKRGLSCLMQIVETGSQRQNAGLLGRSVTLIQRKCYSCFWFLEGNDKAVPGILGNTALMKCALLLFHSFIHLPCKYKAPVSHRERTFYSVPYLSFWFGFDCSQCSEEGRNPLRADRRMSGCSLKTRVYREQTGCDITSEIRGHHHRR